MLEVLEETEITNQLKLKNLTAIAPSYEMLDVIGSGSFGVVYHAKNKETNEVCAIKKVLQDKRYKNRELEMLKELDHINVIKLNHFFYSSEKGDCYLNAVMDYIPDTLSRVIRKTESENKQMPLILAKVYAFQMLRALNYIHSQGICHRDIKPQNILVDSETHCLKICDFGSAKKLLANDSNIAYICSRYYRAPELIFNSSVYSHSVDTWSIGCVIAELVLGFPLFPGNSAINQLVEIIKVLGTPSAKQIRKMNKTYSHFSFPVIKAFTYKEIFGNKVYSEEFVDLLKQLLVYDPSARLNPLLALLHPFFDELKAESTVLPGGKRINDILFNFSVEEVKKDSKGLIKQIVPDWYKTVA